MAKRIQHRVKERLALLIKAHPHWLAEELLEECALQMPGAHLPRVAYISALRHEIGMGHYKKKSTKTTGQPEPTKLAMPTTIEGKVEAMEMLAKAIREDIASQREAKGLIRKVTDGLRPQRSIYETPPDDDFFLSGGR